MVGNSFSRVEGCVGTTSFEIVLTWELEVLAIVMGGAKSFQPLKGVHNKFNPVLKGGAQKVSEQRFSHFVAPPPHN